MRLELPAADPRVARAAHPVHLEQLHRVAQDRAGHPQRLLHQHPAAEIAGHAVLRHPRRRHVVLERRAGGVVEAIRAEPGRELTRRAQRPLVARQLQRLAVGGERHPPVDRAGRIRGQRELPDLHVVAQAHQQYGQGERSADQGGVAQRAPPPGSHDGHVDHRGHDEDLAGLPHRRRAAEQHPGPQHHPQQRPGPPQQHHQAGHHQRLEQNVRHDGLFHLQLVAVQQHRSGSQRCQPPRRALAEQQRVQRHRHPQSQQMLDGGHRARVRHREEGPQHELVAGRIVARVGAEQVLDRVDVEQRGTVGDLREDPQHQPGGQQHGQQPVTAQAPGRQAGRPRAGSAHSSRYCARHRMKVFQASWVANHQLAGVRHSRGRPGATDGRARARMLTGWRPALIGRIRAGRGNSPGATLPEVQPGAGHCSALAAAGGRAARIRGARPSRARRRRARLPARR